MKAAFDKGHIFPGPDGQGYRLVEEVTAGQVVRAEHFEPIGGAPAPTDGIAIPFWFRKQLWDCDE